MTQFISDDTPVSFKSGFTDTDLPLRFIGKIGIPKYKRFLSSITVQVINNHDSVIASVKTNSLGQFMFEDLPKNQNWSFELNQLPDTLPFGSVVVLYDNSGKVIKQFAYENNRFVFKILNSDNLFRIVDFIKDVPDTKTKSGFIFFVKSTVSCMLIFETVIKLTLGYFG